MKTIMNTIARVTISLLFIVTGAFKIFGFDYMVTMFTEIGFPFPNLFLIGAILIELVGGLLLFLGKQTKLMSICLILYVLVATIIVYIPQLLTPENFQMQVTEILKNLSIIGGLLLLIFNNAGKTFSLNLTTDIEDIPVYNVKL